MDMREAIDGHIANVNGSVGILSDSNMTKAAEASKVYSCRGCNHRFYSFYSKFKRDIEAMTEYDNIVVAAQEHAAKHAGAFVYSPAYRKMADALSAERLAFMPSINHISAVYVTGSWVRKVFFSYTDGVKACCRNIRRQWVYEYCSSSCRYF
jgi:hypothetical protein